MYDLYLLGHVAAAAVWVGAAFLMALLGVRMGTARDDRGLVYAQDSEWLGPRVYLPSSMLALAFGLLLVHEGGWGYEPLWIQLGIVALALSTVLGMVVFAPGWGRVRRLVDALGLEASETRARIGALLLFGWVDVGLLAAALFDMVVKPASGDAWALLVCGAIPVVAAAIGLAVRLRYRARGRARAGGLGSQRPSGAGAGGPWRGPRSGFSPMPAAPWPASMRAMGFARSGTPVFSTDRRLRIVEWNRAAESFSGIVAKDAVGRPCWKVVGGKDARGRRVCRPDCAIARLVAAGLEVTSRELEVAFPSGRRAITMSTVVIERLENGLILHFLGAPAIEPKRPPVGRLTPRQREILELLAEGVRVREIADRLVLSEATVRNHVHAILVELGVHSQLEAVARARRLGVIGGRADDEMREISARTG